jgi:hypothetical protein
MEPVGRRCRQLEPDELTGVSNVTGVGPSRIRQDPSGMQSTACCRRIAFVARTSATPDVSLSSLMASNAPFLACNIFTSLDLRLRVCGSSRGC